MVLVNIRMQVPPEKRLELSQTLVSLSDSIRKEVGCQSCLVSQSLENENELLLSNEWKSPADYQRYLESDLSKIFRGAANLLTEPVEIMVHTASTGVRQTL